MLTNDVVSYEQPGPVLVLVIFYVLSVALSVVDLLFVMLNLILAYVWKKVKIDV